MNKYQFRALINQLMTLHCKYHIKVRPAPELDPGLQKISLHFLV